MNETTETTEAANPYRAPEASIDQPVIADSHDILKFKRFSVWGVIGLTIITLGVYIYYWLYSRANVTNSLHESKISLVIPLSLFVLMIFSNIASLDPDLMATPLYFVLSLAHGILYLTVLFKIRNRLQTTINQSSNKNVTLGTVFTFFFNIFYLQYKINECIDRLHFSTSPDPTHSDT